MNSVINLPKLLNQFKEVAFGPEWSENYNVLDSLLEGLKSGRDTLQLKVEGKDRVFSAVLEAFDLERGMLVLGEVYPKENAYFLRARSKAQLTIFGDLNGIKLHCKYLEPLIMQAGSSSPAPQFYQFQFMVSTAEVSQLAVSRFLAGTRIAQGTYNHREKLTRLAS